MVFFNNRKQTFPCRLVGAIADLKVEDLVVICKRLNHLVTGVKSVIMIISVAALSPVKAGVEDLRAVNITGAYLDSNSEKLRSGIAANYLANHIDETNYFDNLSWTFSTNSSYGGEQIQEQSSRGSTDDSVPSEPSFIPSTEIPSVVWNVGLGNELAYSDDLEPEGTSATLGGGDYGYSLLGHLRLGSDLLTELFDVANNSTEPVSPGPSGPGVAAGGCGNPIEKGIPKCQEDGGPIDGKSASGNARATKNQSSAPTITTDSGENDVVLSLPIGSAIYVSPTFWLWGGCADPYCDAVTDSLTAVEVGSTSPIEPTPIADSLIVDPLDPPNPPNFYPPPDTPLPEFAPPPATSVPEPSTLFLVSLGFLGMMLALRKRAAEKSEVQPAS